MLPKIWIFDTYSIMMLLGVGLCFAFFSFISKSFHHERNYTLDILILACITVVVGIFSAVILQYILDLLNGNNDFGSMTFYGGLLGGAGFFILIYFLVLKKRYKNAKFLDILIIAPVCITIAHAFGRIGCFCAGCCYGIETDSIFGVLFPGHLTKVYPTQLFESFFLFILCAVLFFLAYKKKFKYNMCVYLIFYSIFRFCLEFIRGDDRGVMILGLSPAQIISIILFIIGIILIFILRAVKMNKDE